jgi:glycogen synthase
VLGRWLIEGYPKVLLFDINWAMSQLDQWKEEIWKSSYIGVPWSDHDANCAVVFGFVTAIFLAEVIIIHCHVIDLRDIFYL